MYEFLDYRVQDVMSAPVCVGPDATLGEVEAIFEGKHFNGLPVVNGSERLLGWVTSLDLLKAFDFAEDVILPPYEQVMQRKVESVMQRDVWTVCPRTPLERVVHKLVDTGSRSFPVEEDDRVVGVVSRQDVMRALRLGSAGKPP